MLSEAILRNRLLVTTAQANTQPRPIRSHPYRGSHPLVLSHPAHTVLKLVLRTSLKRLLRAYWGEIPPQTLIQLFLNKMSRLRDF